MNEQKPIKYAWGEGAIRINLMTCPRCGAMLEHWGDVIVCLSCMADEMQRRDDEQK